MTADAGDPAPEAPAGRWRRAPPASADPPQPVAPPESAEPPQPVAPPESADPAPPRAEARPIAGFDSVALAGPGEYSAPSPPRRPSRGVRLPVPLLLLGVLLLVGAIAALAAGGLGGGKTVTVGSGAPPASTPAAAGQGLPVSSLPPQSLHVPFVVAGSRFAVFVNPRQPWTRTADRSRLTTGQHYVFVEVLARHVGGAPTDLLALRYRLVTPGGIVTYPVSAVGTGKNALALPHAPQGKALAVSRLAFPVSAPLGSLSLEFEPSTGGGPTIVVPLHS